MNKILIGVTCFYNEEEVERYILELLKQEQETFEFVVSITTNNQNSKDVLLNYFQGLNINKSIIIRVYNADQNLGYLNACLFGIKRCVDEFGIPDWIVISNTDIEFKENSFFSKYMQQQFDEDIWCVGPAIIDNSTQYRNPYIKVRPSKKSLQIKKIIYSSAFLNSLFFRIASFYRKTKEKKQLAMEPSCDLYGIYGCFFIINYSCYEALEAVSKNIFMYGEENLLGEIVRSKKKKTYYWAGSLVYHNNNQVTEKVPDKKKRKWKENSLKFIISNYYK